MAYDEELAHRIRELLAETAGVTETPMFGGLAFLVDGHMTVAASRTGGLLARVDARQFERLIATTDAEPMVMGGRAMTGWLLVPAASVSTKRKLATWVTRSASYTGSLPRKSPKPPRSIKR